jgi:hypothetical protein
LFCPEFCDAFCDLGIQATAGRQEPYTYGSLPGREDFFFVQK